MKRNEKKEIQYTIYAIDKENEDLKVLTFFDNVDEVAKYLDVKRNQVFKIMQGVRRSFINSFEIKIIKDIF